LVTGLVPILSGTFIILTFLGVCIMMTMFIPLSAKPERGFINKFIASSLGSFILLIVIIYISGVFGVFQAKQMFYPSLELARIVQIGNFSGRIELIWFIITVTVLLISSACLLWAFSKGLSQYIGSRNFQPFVHPSALLALILCLTSFNSDIEFDQFIFYVYPIIPAIITFFELLLVITAVISKKSRLISPLTKPHFTMPYQAETKTPSPPPQAVNRKNRRPERDPPEA
jgi:spore germination protein KB